MKWQNKLNQGEMKHLRIMTPFSGHTLNEFKELRKEQNKQGLYCAVCKHIAIKLGIEV